MNAHASQNRFEPMRELHGSRALHRDRRLFIPCI